MLFRSVTAAVDRYVTKLHLSYKERTNVRRRLDMLANLHPVRDLRLSGHVIYTGRSSMEIAVKMEKIEEDGGESTAMIGQCFHFNYNNY